MGWTGTYLYTNPKGKERIVSAIRQEGLEWSDKEHGINSRVIDSALVGNTVYCAVHYVNEEKGRDEVYGCVILTEYRKGEFLTKAISEEMGPCECDCPKRILDKLTPTDREWAKKWREKCEAKRKVKNTDKLKTVAIGKAIRLTAGRNKGKILYAYQHRKTKVFVDWTTSTYYTQKQVRENGYEIVA